MESLDVLLNEKKNLRDEIVVIKKMIYSSLFSVITVVGALCAYLIGKNGLDYFIINKHYIIFSIIVSQIQFIVAVFVLSLDSTLITIGAYIAVIDDKINELVEGKLVNWESHRRRFNNTFEGAEFYCFVAVYAFFLILFVLSIILNSVEILRNYQFVYLAFLIAQLIEFIVVALIAIKKHKEFKKAKVSFARSQSIKIRTINLQKRQIKPLQGKTL